MSVVEGPALRVDAEGTVDGWSPILACNCLRCSEHRDTPAKHDGGLTPRCSCVHCGYIILEGELRTNYRGHNYCTKCCCSHCCLPLGANGDWVTRNGRKYCFKCRPRKTERSQPAKHDQGKPRYDLIPPEGIEAIARVLTYGADKYGDRNWEGGLAWGRVFAACMRHLWAWWRGGGVDKESGLSHLAHAACCLLFLIAYEARGVGDDDRKWR